MSSLPVLEERLKAAYKTTTEGKFGEALKLFQGIIHAVAVLLVESRREVDEVRELLGIAREYAVALRIEMKRKEHKEDPKRAAELAAYFTHCSMQPIHLSLSLRSAMIHLLQAEELQHRRRAFARRLLELNAAREGGAAGEAGAAGVRARRPRTRLSSTTTPATPSWCAPRRSCPSTGAPRTAHAPRAARGS